MSADYRAHPVSLTLADMAFVAAWISNGSTFHQRELPDIRDKFDRVIGLLLDIRGTLSEDRISAALAAATQEG